MNVLEYVDSHTAGEPTRLIIGGVPQLGTVDPAEARDLLRRDHDWLRTTTIREPRGSDVLVGAALLPHRREDADAAIVFFNNVGYLGMCGHGTIGVVASLAYLELIGPGKVRIDTPPGRIDALLHEDGSVSLQNVASYRYRKNVPVDVPGHGRITGDIAYGGNWFFLVNGYSGPIEQAYVEELTSYTWAVRQALHSQGITGQNGAEIDHIELFGPSTIADSRNFVLCPGKAYDRSPCGTGTSAKLACLFEDGKIAEGEEWRQESVIGSVFEGKVQVQGGQIIPTISGRAWVTGRGQLLMEDTDPFRFGIQP